MAIYHFSAKVISRADGSSAVAAAAYRSASRLEDERLGRGHDFTNKAGVVHSEIMLAEGAAERWRDREVLWNEVEAREPQKNSQLAREVEFSIPREMSQADGVKLARDYVEREFVDRGMVADLNVHWDRAEDESEKPHAHVMLTMRKPELGADGEVQFGPKAREWNDRALLQGWREAWADLVNERLCELGIEARIDHRTLEAQGIALEPQNKIGPAGMRREERGEDAERAFEHREIARRNGEKIIADPSVALDAITRQQSTFTDHDLARLVHRHSDDVEQYGRVLGAVKASPELVALGRDGRGRERFSTREMLEVEARLERAGEGLAARDGHEVSAATINREIAAADKAGLTLGEEQLSALEHIVRPGDLAMTVGYAGTGKSAMLGVAREAWERSGYSVRGAALSGIAAETLEAGSAIPSRTLASLEHGWGQGRDALTSKDVLVIDEAGMIGSRQLERVLSAAELAGAKVVMVGDPEQLQAIEAGAAFRALSERHGAAEITQVRRQREDWQKAATRDLATGRTHAALDAYEGAGMVEGHRTRDEARAVLVDGWNAERRADPNVTQVILAHTRVDVAELNALARERMRTSGALSAEVTLQTERGERAFAEGDRVMFLRNERGMGVTVDRAHVLATPGLDRHAAYVALSRHRDGVALHYGEDDFPDRETLDRTLERERAKDTTLDYAKAFAARREIHVPVELQEPERKPGKKKGMFDGLKLGRVGAEPEAQPRAPEPEASPAVDPQVAQGQAVTIDYARAFADSERMSGGVLLPHQKAELARTGKALVAAIGLDKAGDVYEAFRRQPSLAARIEEPAGMVLAVTAAVEEGKVRVDPELRADRFVEDYAAMRSRHAELAGPGRGVERQELDLKLRGVLAGIDSDPAMKAVLESRQRDLDGGRAPEREIGKAIGRERERERGMDRER